MLEYDAHLRTFESREERGFHKHAFMRQGRRAEVVSQFPRGMTSFSKNKIRALGCRGEGDVTSFIFSY